jgi:alpha-ketoglutarate-dependent 2,4-dichlorophenoxyacetate dioxygenase
VQAKKVRNGWRKLDWSDTSFSFVPYERFMRARKITLMAGKVRNMSLLFTPFTEMFGCECSGLDLREPLDSTSRDAVQNAFDKYSVVVFRDQRLTNEQQMDFAAQFGPLERSAISYKSEEKLRFETLAMVDVSNVDANTGQPEKREARHRLMMLGNRLWHTDSSFRVPCGALSMLYAHVVPDEGGDTEFADTRAAYAALPESRKRELDGLEAQHSTVHAKEALGFNDWSPEERDVLTPVTQPIVRVHPRTREKALYLGAIASHIICMPVPEGRVLLMELQEWATQREFVYCHKWRVGDLVVWDNLKTLHRGRSFDESQVRDLRRVTTSNVGRDSSRSASRI